MFGLDNLLSNPVIGKALFGQLKGIFTEKDLDFIMVRLDEQGEVELLMYKSGEAVVCPVPDGMTQAELYTKVSDMVAGKSLAKQPTSLKPAGLIGLKGGKKGGKNA